MDPPQKYRDVTALAKVDDPEHPRRVTVFDPADGATTAWVSAAYGAAIEVEAMR